MDNSKYSVSFSGGKDSTAMLHLLIDKQYPLDDIVFFDTGWEWPEMYDHINLVEKNIGRPITRLLPPKPFVYYLTEKEITKGKWQGLCGYGWPWVKGRWCTRLKVDTMRKHIGKESIQYIGIAADEPKRIKDNPLIKYPLVEMGFTENDCLNYCYSLGYTWGGLYNTRNRLSCFCCPLQRTDSIRMLYNERPELWEYMKSIDRQSPRHSTPSLFHGKTLAEWADRFDREKEKDDTKK